MLVDQGRPLFTRLFFTSHRGINTLDRAEKDCFIVGENRSLWLEKDPFIFLSRVTDGCNHFRQLNDRRKERENLSFLRHKKVAGQKRGINKLRAQRENCR